MNKKEEKIYSLGATEMYRSLVKNGLIKGVSKEQAQRLMNTKNVGGRKPSHEE